MGTTIDRNLYYYDLYAMYHDKENNICKRDDTSELIVNFLEDLYQQQLKSKDFSEFIIQTSKKDDLFVVIDNVEEEYIEYRIVLCRKDALPYIQKAGILESLDKYIDKEHNVAEITHCVFFKKFGVMGAEFNFSGARPSAIAEYIINIEKNIPVVFCTAKLNMDTYSKIIADEEFSLFSFAVKSNSDLYNQMLSKKSIFSVMQKSVPEADVIEVTFKKRKVKKNKNKGFLSPFSLDEIKEVLENYREDIKKFTVSQGTYKDSIDLLTDKLVTKIAAIKTNERTIDSEAMYQEIRKFFNQTVKQCCS